MSAPRLIVTADDFGASREVNEAVELAFREGVLRAASLLRPIHLPRFAGEAR